MYIFLLFYGAPIDFFYYSNAIYPSHPGHIFAWKYSPLNEGKFNLSALIWSWPWTHQISASRSYIPASDACSVFWNGVGTKSLSLWYYLSEAVLRLSSGCWSAHSPRGAEEGTEQPVWKCQVFLCHPLRGHKSLCIRLLCRCGGDYTAPNGIRPSAKQPV